MIGIALKGDVFYAVARPNKAEPRMLCVNANAAPQRNKIHAQA
jgi:hypothetical protein